MSYVSRASRGIGKSSDENIRFPRKPQNIEQQIEIVWHHLFMKIWLNSKQG